MQEEIYGVRDRSYSAWHRRNSTRRYVGIEQAQMLAMIDIDAALWVEYDDGTKEPLALVETAEDKGQAIKPATVIRNLAMRSNLPAYVLLYKLDDKPNPAAPECYDISQFRCRRVWPEPATDWEMITPQQWANRLVDIRRWSAKQIDKCHQVA